MEMLAKYIRMRTARSAATASHPCVERSTEGIKKKNPVDVTPRSFLPSFFPKKASIKHAQRGVRDNPLSLPSFLSRERKRLIFPPVQRAELFEPLRSFHGR
ncbi:MAG: hypothetical protein E7057_11105 [Lentisphaerae bacterium]|nr:hypothetical protein [Lentisphaerota bacterium]